MLVLLHVYTAPYCSSEAQAKSAVSRCSSQMRTAVAFPAPQRHMLPTEENAPKGREVGKFDRVWAACHLSAKRELSNMGLGWSCQLPLLEKLGQGRIHPPGRFPGEAVWPLPAGGATKGQDATFLRRDLKLISVRRGRHSLVDSHVQEGSARPPSA